MASKWMPCCKPCPDCEPCIPGTWLQSYTATVTFEGAPADQDCLCSDVLIGTIFELPRIGIRVINTEVTCCEYYMPIHVCDSPKGYFDWIRYSWCTYNARDAAAVLELHFVCDLQSPDGPYEGTWEWTCPFFYDFNDPQKGRDCSCPIRVSGAAFNDTGCIDYSLCFLFDVTGVIRFVSNEPLHCPDEVCYP